MNEIQKKHGEAMNMVEETMIPSIRHDKEKVKELNKKAFILERECAEETPIGAEPTKSVLYRSAGWMAIGAEQYEDALIMAEEGLKGVIHSDIKEELLELKIEAEKLIKN